MTLAKRIVLTSLAGLIVLESPAWGASEATRPSEDKRSEDKGREIASDDTSGPVYNPPLRGAPGGRVGGGTRGTAGDVFVISVLAPDHTGLTTKPQPSLFWFISAATTLPVELTIVDPGATTPVLEMRFAPPVERGVHRVRLADHGVTLTRGVAYQWSVAAIPDPARRSRDILASGTIQRLEPDPAVSPKFATARGEELASQYARAGFWYDALETVSDLMERSPSDTTPRRYRAALLTQAGLPEVNQQPDPR